MCLRRVLAGRAGALRASWGAAPTGPRWRRCALCLPPWQGPPEAKRDRETRSQIHMFPSPPIHDGSSPAENAPLIMEVPMGRCTDEWWKRFPSEKVATIIESVGCMLHSCSNEEADQKVRDLQNQMNGMRSAFAQSVEVFQTTVQTIQSAQPQPAQPSAISAQQLGTVAEHDVEDLLKALECDVEHVGKEGGKGDLLLTTTKGLRIMVEVKNCKALHSSNDIEKFKRDTKEGVQTGRINSSLLISLKCPIPNKGKSILSSEEYVDPESGTSISTFYLASNQKDVILAVVKSIEIMHLQKVALERGRDASVDELNIQKERGILQTQLYEIFKIINSKLPSFPKRQAAAKKAWQDLLEDEKGVRELLTRFSSIEPEIPWLSFAKAEERETKRKRSPV